MSSKLKTMEEAIDQFVHDGDTVFLGGFIHNESFAAAHEIIRQRRRELTISKAAGDIMVDQLVGAGCVARLIVSYLWNPIPPPRSAHGFRRAIEQGIPRPVQIEDYTVFTLTAAYMAGSLGLPFMPTRSAMGSDIEKRRTFLGESKMKVIECPFTGEKIALVPGIRHDVGILQVHRADERGNAQVRGVLGDARYGINACEKVILCAEEIVDEETIRAEQNHTVIPAFKVSAVVRQPWGAHPSYMQGLYNLDVEAWKEYGSRTKTVDGMVGFLEEWVFGVGNHEEYLQKLGESRLRDLRADPCSAGLPKRAGHEKP